MYAYYYIPTISIDLMPSGLMDDYVGKRRSSSSPANHMAPSQAKDLCCRPPACGMGVLPAVALALAAVGTYELAGPDNGRIGVDISNDRSIVKLSQQVIWSRTQQKHLSFERIMKIHRGFQN